MPAENDHADRHDGDLAAAKDQVLVVVHRAWNRFHTAWVRLADLEGVHWSQPFGAPRSLIHARISCHSIVMGSLPHDCDTKTRPHYLTVCILKGHSDTGVFQELLRRADAR
jgi:hypothetical protein